MSNIFLEEIENFFFNFPALLLIVANFPKPTSFYLQRLLPSRLLFPS